MKRFENDEALEKWLRAQKIDVDRWGRGAAKTVENLWAEINHGETRLQEDPLRRLIEVVRVVVHRDIYVLIEARQEFAGGRQRLRNRPPSEKMRPDEDYEAAAYRCLEEELGVPASAVTLYPATYRRRLWEAESDSYPGLCTRYTFHIIQADVSGLPQGEFSTEEQATGAGEPVRKHFWVWHRTLTRRPVR
jgi:hypothetical protein